MINIYLNALALIERNEPLGHELAKVQLLAQKHEVVAHEQIAALLHGLLQAQLHNGTFHDDAKIRAVHFQLL